MDGSFLLGSVVLAIAAVVLFIVFYSLRLLKASRDAKEAAERFQVMMHKQGELRENFALMGEARGVSEGSETISSSPGFWGEWMILAEEDEEGRLVITRLG